MTRPKSEQAVVRAAAVLDAVVSGVTAPAVPMVRDDRRHLGTIGDAALSKDEAQERVRALAQEQFGSPAPSKIPPRCVGAPLGQSREQGRCTATQKIRQLVG